jgi:DNA-binding NarL/FixJ family response regulator
MAERVGLLLSDDLIDASRVTATARAADAAFLQVRSVNALLQQARSDAPACVIVDLHFPELDVAELAHELGALDPKPQLIGYGSHVDAARLRAARQAGCDLVMPRSQFFDLLSTEIEGWLRAKRGHS